MVLPSFTVVLPLLNDFLIKLGMPLNLIPRKNQEFFYGITRQTMELRKTDKDQVFLALYVFHILFIDIFNKKGQLLNVSIPHCTCNFVFCIYLKKKSHQGFPWSSSDVHNDRK